MSVLASVAGVFLHLDKHLLTIIEQHGAWTYALLFLVVFCETGFVVTPFLPGDSLLFAAGTFAGAGSLNIAVILALLWLAGIIGDGVNYGIGRFFGARVSRYIRPAYIEKTHGFYAKYGAKTIVIARFVPIVRTIAPFVAGVAKMDYRVFTMFNIIGSTLWVGVLVGGGYLFGNIPIIRDNFSIAILIIIVVSILPAVIELIKHRRATTNTQ
jgi:membrane-associated protein